MRYFNSRLRNNAQRRKAKHAAIRSLRAHRALRSPQALCQRLLCCFVIPLFVIPALAPKSAFGQWATIENYREDFLNIGSYLNITTITSTNKYAYFAAADGVLRYDILNERWMEPLNFFGVFAGSVVYRLAASFDDEKLWAETKLGVFLYERLFGYWSEVNEFPAYEISGETVRADRRLRPLPGPAEAETPPERSEFRALPARPKKHESSPQANLRR